jgi:hypothetical protein
MYGADLLGPKRYLPFTAMLVTLPEYGEPGRGVSAPLEATTYSAISLPLLFFGVKATYTMETGDEAPDAVVVAAVRTCAKTTGAQAPVQRNALRETYLSVRIIDISP